MVQVLLGLEVAPDPPDAADAAAVALTHIAHTAGVRPAATVPGGAR
jgi:Holliday junction resolvasome RuvABC endonuclease subunit